MSAGVTSARLALVALVERLAGGRVACVGDIMLDRYVLGRVERISPEVPIPVLSVDDETAMPGGVGNVARNVRALGARPWLIAAVGDDAGAGELRDLLAAEPDIRGDLAAEPGRRTAIKTRYLAGAQQILRADRETVRPLAEATRADILRMGGQAIAACAVLVLSDYGKGVLADGVAGALIERARAAGKPVIVDPKGRDFAVYRGADLVAPNRAELFGASGRGIAAGGEGEAARELIARFGFAAVLATLGKDGMLLVTADDAASLPAEAREVYDVSGAGDTVVATMAAALATGADLRDAAALANVAAGIVVGKVGTAVVYADELIGALRRRDLLHGDGKIATFAAACDHVRRWRRQGMRIGFTNGCFDLLHPGHISLLDQAKAHCDRLVVGLNTDTSVARLKGPGRPVQSEAARAAVLASLASVDLVTPFAEDTPLRLIEALRPDVLVKGADYRRDQVVGADLVVGWGGSVVLADLAPGHSTTATIARIAE